MNWPSLSQFTATVGRLATEDDTRANRAVFLLRVGSTRIGKPIEMRLPCYAWALDTDAREPQACILLQAEEADGKKYFGGWLIDEKRQIMGFATDFKVLSDDEVQDA